VRRCRLFLRVSRYCSGSCPQGCKPPPARTAAAFATIMAQSGLSFDVGSSVFTYVSDEVTGALRTSVWPGVRTRESIEEYAVRALQPPNRAPSDRRCKSRWPSRGAIKTLCLVGLGRMSAEALKPHNTLYRN
jgi:hypothetical protein